MRGIWHVTRLDIMWKSWDTEAWNALTERAKTRRTDRWMDGSATASPDRFEQIEKVLRFDWVGTEIGDIHKAPWY